MVEIPSPTPHLRALSEGAIGWLVLNRPDRHNALTAAMWAGIPELVAALARAPDVRVIIVRGQGETAFASGADISEFQANRNNADAARQYEVLNGAALQVLRSTAKPVIAAISGFCIGGGLAIALACDLRIASHQSVFALPPARLGLAYPADGLRDLLAAVTPAAAKDLLFTGRRVTAAEALQLGLVNQLLQKEKWLDGVAEIGRVIADNAPLTITASKRAVDRLSGRSGAVDDQELARLMAACFDSEDYAEGCRAFLEKRPPSFRGR